MATILLSGVGGSSNWLPMLLPLVAILGIYKSVGAYMKYRKERHALHHHEDTPVE